MKEWRWKELTPRQKEIALAVVLNGNTKQHQIGRQFGICYGTVIHHLSKVYKILGVHSKLEMAFEMGKHWKEIKSCKT